MLLQDFVFYSTIKSLLLFCMFAVWAPVLFCLQGEVAWGQDLWWCDVQRQTGGCRVRQFSHFLSFFTYIFWKLVWSYTVTINWDINFLHACDQSKNNGVWKDAINMLMHWYRSHKIPSTYLYWISYVQDK